MKFSDPSAGQHGRGAPTVIFRSARLVRKGEKLEDYHPEAAETPRGDAAGQLVPKPA